MEKSMTEPKHKTECETLEFVRSFQSAIVRTFDSTTNTKCEEQKSEER